MTASRESRRNPHTGLDCPPWCVTDHDQVSACIGSGTIGSRFLADVWARAILAPRHADDGAMVAVTGHAVGQDGTHQVELPPHVALSLAGIVELLAGATPDQHRELAAGIRKAAADITSTDGAQP
jgi:hypothetical protein